MKKVFLAAILFLYCFSYSTVYAQPEVQIIPQPVQIITKQGEFKLNGAINIYIDTTNAALQFLANKYGSALQHATGLPFNVYAPNSQLPGIHLKIYSKKDSLGDEGYRLHTHSGGIFIEAHTPAGLLYGLETLKQLLPPEINSETFVPNVNWKVPFVTIVDYPRFQWRGMLLDVVRHFFTIDEVKGFINNMVAFKFNKLHLHLSDDQGWRIEIKSLPRLTEFGAWRAPRVGRWTEFSKPTPDEPRTYGGFYTQEEMKELIQYAKDRNVTIIPEIDVPGHSLAAVACFPELSCTPGTYQVNAGDKFMVWEKGTFYGLVDNTLCPANENVYDFLDKVFTEIAALFPSDYIHIGGDEAYKGYWEKSDAVKNLMKKEGLKNMDEVQSYFIKRVQKIISSKGKKMIGWDEILDGGLAPNAIVMSWRGMKGGVAAANMGHQVIMTPNDFAYLDLYQGDPVAEVPTYGMVLLNKAYQFDPLPEDIDPKYILGGQCNLWSERLSTMRHAQYMLWPRALATSESLWSKPKDKNWVKFVQKVETQMLRFDYAQIKYSRSMYDPSFSASLDAKDSLLITLQTQIDGLKIHYSFDETEPDNFYPVYFSPLTVPKDAANLRVVTYRDGKQIGKLIVMPIAELRKRVKNK